MAVTYHVVVVFDRDEEGDLKPGEAREATSAAAAERHARLLAGQHAGTVAFSRTGDREPANSTTPRSWHSSAPSTLKP
jgi:hypothetical protein